jgi:integrase/recombinase XerD
LLGMEGRYRDWTILGMFAGFRAGDIIKVHAAHLESRSFGWVLRIPDGKGGVDAVIPAHDSVVAVIQRHAGKVGPIWPILPDTMSCAWSAAARAVGIDGKFHQNRHTYGTRLYETSKDIAVTSRLMRHASLATTMIYTQISQETEFAAVSGL